MNLGDLIDSSSSTDLTSAGASGVSEQSIQNFITEAGTVLSTIQLEQINLVRAQKGLPPISAQSVAPTVNVGLSSGTLLLIALGIGALLLFSKKG